VLDVTVSGCYLGHTGRLCAQCSVGYFSSGRWCLECLSDGVHVLILLLNLAVLVALVVYLFLQQPNQSRAHAALLQYQQEAVLPAVKSLSTADISEIDAQQSLSISPLRLLIFHSQQLSLLLLTTASLPSTFAGLLAVFSSGANGFSLSSLTAMECLQHAWSIPHRCWAAVFAAVLVGLAALCTFVVDHCRRSHAADPFSANRGHSASTFTASSVYSVCVSLCYLLVFPCATTALSALACTDWREWGSNAYSSQTSRLYLNLYPWQQCDASWQSEILPPALIATVFWCVLFPIAGTVLLKRSHAQLSQRSQSVQVDAEAILSWCVASDLLKPYSSRLWHWEQVLLARRLLLVSAVAFIPANSLYLPLTLLALVQLSALLQHFVMPYRSWWLNVGELSSLYLLLLNYSASVVAASGVSGASATSNTDSGWLTGLFVLNTLFMAVLVFGLFAWVRRVMLLRFSGVWKKFVRSCCANWMGIEEEWNSLDASREGIHTRRVDLSDRSVSLLQMEESSDKQVDLRQSLL
jgi:hypothetical protein